MRTMREHLDLTGAFGAAYRFRLVEVYVVRSFETAGLRI